MSVADPDAGRRHVVSALVNDRPGTLNRVASLLRARGFNVDSLSVARTHEPDRSRMTIVLRGDDRHLSQVLSQLDRLIDVLEVRDLTDVPHVEMELALAEVAAPSGPDEQRQLEATLSRAGGALLERLPSAWQVRLAAPPAQLEAALAMLAAGHGLKNLVRAGAVAMTTTTLHATPTDLQNEEIPA